MPVDEYVPEPTWSYRIDHFEQAAPKSRLIWTAVILGLLICGLFALLVFGGFTREDWQAYTLGVPLFFLLYFTGRRQNRFARSPFPILLLAIPSAALVVIFVIAGEDTVRSDRGYKTDTVVTEVEKHARRFPTCKLEEPDGDPIHGSISCGNLKVGDRVTVIADPSGRVDPSRGFVSRTRIYVGFAVCAFLVMLSTVLGAVLGIRRRGSVLRWWPPASPPRNYGQPSSPFPPPPPPPPPGGPSGGPRG
ncbi:hypothetical protein GCM10010400_04240 [Streptomyces aculeolatus]|uniref:hypothetical protein n=1 Tax=Streptomyces aculeolatus TaxID=270689 RepID=UPI001CEC0C61|nr:hypothetical protein [Streptomyces aculeolatus]